MSTSNSTSSASESESPQGTPCKKTRKTKTNYAHKYKPEWETKFSWISASKLGRTYFLCKCCNKNLLGGIAAVKKHDNTRQHAQKAKAIKMQIPLHKMSVMGESQINKTKELEIRAASFLVEHNISLSTADHLEGLLKECAKYPDAAKNISCKRTKCTSIVKGVTGNYFFTQLVAKVRKTNFSIMIDESTDHSSTKNLAVVIRFIENLKVNDQFLTLIPVANATADNLYNIIVNFFNSNNIDYKSNLIGFGADGANTMMGVNHSVQKLLKNDVPHLAVFKCICHSLALCVSNACLKLPRIPEDLVRDIYSYFQYSFKRQQQFSEFQHFAEVRPHKILQNCQTRWLSLTMVVKRVLEQYNALKLYFQSEYLIDRVQASEIIFNRLSDPMNMLYLEFMEHILPYILDLNIEFQSEAPRVHVLYAKMETLFKSILEFYIDEKVLQTKNLESIDYTNPRLFVKLENIYLGPKIAAKFTTNEFSDQEKNSFRRRCLEFYIELTSQICKRFDFKSTLIKDLKKLNFMDPREFKKIDSLGPLNNAIIFSKFFETVNVNELDREWRLLRNSDLANNHIKLENYDITNFWQEVAKISKGDNTPYYPNLIKLVSYIFTLPHSSAAVERVFSIINLNKTKNRNRLNSSTLEGILYTKSLIAMEGNKNCFNYDIKTDMLKNHNYNMYSD